MKNKFLKGLVASFALAISGFANAGLISIDFGPESSEVDGVDFLFNLATPTSIIGDATLELYLQGDFCCGDSATEYADIFLDGLSLGRVLDEITGNDRFNFPINDIAQSAFDPILGSATITLAEMLPMLADGNIILSINTSSAVGAVTTTVSGTLSFETVDVPEPSTLAVFTLGLMGLASRKFKKQA